MELERTLPSSTQGSSTVSLKEVLVRELETMLLSERPSEHFALSVREHRLHNLLPELAACVGFDQRTPRHHLDVFRHTMAVVDGTPPDIILRWAALLHDVAKPLCFSLDSKGIGHFYGHDAKSAEMADFVLRRLGYPEEFALRVSRLIYYHMTRIHFRTERAVRKVSRKLGEEDTERLLLLFKADRGAHSPDNSDGEPVPFETIYRRLREEEKKEDTNGQRVEAAARRT